MALKPDIPLDTQAIDNLIDDPDDLFLVWPKARWPFDHNQWRRAWAPASRHHPFLICDKGRLIGNAALRAAGIRHVSIASLKPGPQGQAGEYWLCHIAQAL